MNCPGCGDTASAMTYVGDRMDWSTDGTSVGELFIVFSRAFCSDCYGICPTCSGPYRDVARHVQSHARQEVTL